MQSAFIKQLGKHDSHQNGSAVVSNGHSKMARIYLINKFNINALTHETIRNVPKNADDLRPPVDPRQTEISMIKTSTERMKEFNGLMRKLNYELCQTNSVCKLH